MTYITLDTRKTDRVALMTLHYKKENRFHPDFMAEITETLDRPRRTRKSARWWSRAEIRSSSATASTWNGWSGMLLTYRQ